MFTVGTLLCHVYSRHIIVSCLQQARYCVMFTVGTLLCHVYSRHIIVSCLQ